MNTALRPKTTIRMVSTYPTEGEGISRYTCYLIDELRIRAFTVTTTKIYFLKSKLSTMKCLGLLGANEDVVHLQYTPTGAGPLVYLFAALRPRNKKFLITSHELPSTYAKHLPVMLRTIFRAFERMLHNAAGMVTVHTVQHRSELLALGVSPSKVTIVPFPVYPAARQRGSEESNLRHGIFFGRITPKKGLEVLFEAVRLLPHDITFSIIGPPALTFESYAETLKERAKSLGIIDRVAFCGFLDDASVSAALFKAGFAVFPYYYITQSAALMTAIGHGLPYVASNLPAFKEACERYKGGLLFDTGNARSLAEAIMQCVDRATHEKLAGESRAAREHYTWQAYTDTMVGLYGN